MRPTVDSRPDVIRRGSDLRYIPFLALVLVPTAAAAGRVPTPGAAAFDPGCSDPRAIAVADLALRAVGGPERLERIRFLRFAFVLQRGREEVRRRTHLWDRVGRRLRYESVDEEGAPLVAILHLDDPTGPVYRAGQEVHEPLASRLRSEAYDAWRSDSYWLLMPYRLKDPGICMEYGGEVVEGDGRLDRLYLTFAEDGPAPRGRYRADFDRRTHLLALWGGTPPEGEADPATTIWRWGDWRRQDGLLFAYEKESLSRGDTLRIVHPVLDVLDEVSETEFLSRTSHPPDPVP